jgi:hypothetical protein
MCTGVSIAVLRKRFGTNPTWCDEHVAVHERR